MKRAFLLTLALVSALFVVGNAAAATLTVDDNGADCANAAYTTIQSAVDAAKPGDTIKVCAGTYQESVDIQKDRLKLESTPALAAVIKAPAVVEPDPQAIVSITNAKDVSVKGFTISGPYTNPPGSCVGEHYGVYVGANASNAKIEKNRVTEIRSADPALRGCQDGFAIGVDARTGPSSASIRENTVDLFQKDGINVFEMNAFATVENNVVKDAGASEITAPNGIEVDNGAIAKIKNNDVSGMVYDLAPASNGTGILLFEAGAGSEVANNNVFANDDGISLYDTTGVKVHDNFSHDQLVYDGFFADSGSTGNVFENNKASGNHEHDCHDDSTGTGTAGTGNTWKKDKGVNDTPDGICKP
jgi:nitrous oxidase accessory protein NosD